MNSILLASLLIAHFEGLCFIPYLEPAHYWAIGYGSRTLADGTSVHKDIPPISREEADALFEGHLLALQRNRGGEIERDVFQDHNAPGLTDGFNAQHNRETQANP